MKTYVTILMVSLLPLAGLAQHASWLFPPVYDAIQDFHEGVAAVSQQGLWGYVTDDGRELTPCRYETIHPFVGGVGGVTSPDHALMAIVHGDGQVIQAFSNRSGEQVSLWIDPRYPHFSDGLLLITDGQTQLLYGKRYKKWGYLDATGKLAIDIKYVGALPFSEGKAGVALSDLTYFYIGTNDKAAITNDFNNGRNAIGALGFTSDRKALIVDAKGLAYIDESGRRTKEKPLSFTPLENYYDISTNRLRGVEGELIIDTKGRVSAFIDKVTQRVTALLPSADEGSRPSGGAILLGETNREGEADWQTDRLAIVRAATGKYGVVQLTDHPAVSITEASMRIESVFGGPAPFQCYVKNASGNVLKDLVVTVGGHSETLTLPSEVMKPIAVQVPKQTDAREEQVNIEVFAYDNGLQVTRQWLTVTVCDKPSMYVELPVRTFELDEGANVYPLPVVVRNQAALPVDEVQVKVNETSQVVSFGPNEEKTLRFMLPASTSQVDVQVKPQQTPAITLHETVRIHKPSTPVVKVEEEEEAVETPEAGIGSLKK